MITVLGAGGFIGSHVVNVLRQSGIEHYAPDRNEPYMDKDLGDVIYCIGLTADFRSRPMDTVQAHVCILNQLLERGRFSSLLYLSSTRIYIHSPELRVTENDRILVDPLSADDLYTLTKLTGERLCLSSGRNCKIVRLSNVIGAYQDQGVFLSQLINRIRQSGHLVLEQALGSAKDYIGIDEVVPLLIKLTGKGDAGIYNIASGINTTHKDLIEALEKHFKFTYSVTDHAPEVVFPLISNKKIQEMFGFVPKMFSEQLPLILEK